MKSSRSHPEFKQPSETMRAWAEALRAELEQWPAMRITRGFGMIFIYRGDTVFAALPGTRMLQSEDAIMLKFQAETPALVSRIAADPRFTAAHTARNPKGESHKWRFFLLHEDADLHAAIEWLADAYQAARKRRPDR
jgi:hypothetical protein